MSVYSIKNIYFPSYVIFSICMHLDLKETGKLGFGLRVRRNLCVWESGLRLILLHFYYEGGAVSQNRSAIKIIYIWHALMSAVNVLFIIIMNSGAYCKSVGIST
jgi:hypothetical protein